MKIWADYISQGTKQSIYIKWQYSESCAAAFLNLIFALSSQICRCYFENEFL